MTRDKAIAELVRIWHSPHLDLILKARLTEVIETLKGGEKDCDYERAVDQMEHDVVYEPTYNSEDGSM